MLIHLSQDTIREVIALADQAEAKAPKFKGAISGAELHAYMQAHPVPVQQQLKDFLGGLSTDELVELQALMWQGRDGAADARMPFSEQLAHSTRRIDQWTPAYISGKFPRLSEYLTHGLKSLQLESSVN